MARGEDGHPEPHRIGFSEGAQLWLNDFRGQGREWETMAEGLLLSFLGKLPGVVVRLSLLLAYMDWVSGEVKQEPGSVLPEHIERALLFVDDYLRPMAERAYLDVAMPKEQLGARRLLGLIREKDWREFSTREVLRCGRPGLSCKPDLDPVLRALEEAYAIRRMDTESTRKGGQPPKRYEVNPMLL